MFAFSRLKIFVLLSIFTFSSFAFAANSDEVWQEIDDSDLSKQPVDRTVKPSEYKTFRLNISALRYILESAPMEFSDESRNNPVILKLPMPNGDFERFRIEKSPIMEEGLAQKYPEIRTFRGYGIDDRSASVRFDLMPSGFHSMILSPRGTVFVDPYAVGDTLNYVSYFKKNVRNTSEFVCEFDEKNEFESISRPEQFDPKEFVPALAAPSVISGTELRTYRLALAATNEYAVAVGSNTVAGTLAAQMLIMNRVNGVYERDLAIRMVTVANNNLIIYAADNMCAGVPCTSANDPYNNASGSAMLGENTTNLNSVIMSANYDIGHVFSTGGGGVATLNGPCGGSKARGVTGLTNPVGDPFAIDYVAHEMGHQWGSNHTFNGAVSSCSGGNRSAANAYEPGSGVTIMAYAGICGNQNLAGNSIDTFHVRSLEVIVAFSQTGNGNACAVTTATGNTPPAVSIVGAASNNIPKQTPFSLSANATDVNNDSITYDWQEYDLGASTTAVPNTDSDGARPIFRPYLPTEGGTRTFPSIQYILNNANVPPPTTGGFLTGELLPAITRTMNFQVVARDNRADGGGINTATAQVVVDGNSGPFTVTAPNTGVSIPSGSTQTITWNVANTTNAPVNATDVQISLSLDGGNTFPIVLRGATPNDGTESVAFPFLLQSNSARIKIKAVGNIFFDISDANFTITQSLSFTQKPLFDFDGDSKTDIGIFRPAQGEWWYLRSSDNGNRAFQFGSTNDKIVAADYTGDSKTDIAFFRPTSNEWFILRSEDSSFYSFPFGAAGDIPVPADYDGDGKADPAIFRPSNSTWYIVRSTDTGTTITQFGAAGDKPVPADYDGDRKTDLAIFRPNGGGAQWWILRSTAGLTVANFGVPTDKTVPADYTGDGKTDVAFFRPSSNEWFILRSEDSSFYSAPFGAAGDVPTPGDYDGDARADFAIFRPSTNTWYLQRSTSGFTAVTFGTTNDFPLPSAFVR